MFNCLFLNMAIETNNLEAVNMMIYQSDSKCSQVGAQSPLHNYAIPSSELANLRLWSLRVSF